jgi:hypothetical protein
MLPAHLQMPKISRREQLLTQQQGQILDLIKKVDQVHLAEDKPGVYRAFDKYDRPNGIKLDKAQMSLLKTLMTQEDKPLVIHTRTDGRYTELTTVKGKYCSLKTQAPCRQQFELVGERSERPRSILETARWMVEGKPTSPAVVGMPPKSRARYLEDNGAARAEQDTSTGVDALEEGWIKSALSGAAEAFIEPAFIRRGSVSYDGVATVQERVPPDSRDELQHHLYVRAPGGKRVFVGALTHKECREVCKDLKRTNLPWQWQRIHDLDTGHTLKWKGPNRVKDDLAPDISEVSSKNVRHVLRGAHEVRIVPTAQSDEPRFQGKRQCVETLDADGSILGWDVPYPRMMDLWHIELAKTDLPVAEWVGRKDAGKWHYSLRGQSLSEEEYRQHRDGPVIPSLSAE